ncbi:MAG TPA: hypothetical protein VGD29_33690 [Actinoplanes sp.]|jgi:hypothetical protein
MPVLDLDAALNVYGRATDAFDDDAVAAAIVARTQSAPEHDPR